MFERLFEGRGGCRHHHRDHEHHHDRHHERHFGGRGGFGGFGRGRGHGHGFGPFGGGRGEGPFGGGGFGGGGRERMFDSGDIKLVIVKLLSEQPSHGYQLIKTMEERLGGGYTPSAGVIYPTLTLLEEEGLAVSSADSNKKVYALTPDGDKYLADNKARIDELFARLDQAGEGFARGRAPELMRAFHNLRHAAMARMARGNVTAEQVKKMADAINAAARQIDEL